MPTFSRDRVGFHGYGENGEILLKAVCEIPGTSGWHVVAIQALHPFYDRKTGTVGASWMTSQDRDLAISDNIAYVTRAIDEVGRHLALRRPTVFLGFSQGTAMAYRTAFLSIHGCDGLIALGGDTPSEVQTASVQTASAPTIPRVLIGRGASDTWYDESKLDIDVARLTGIGTTVETCVFDGGHEWTDAFRRAAADFLRELLGTYHDKT